MYRVVVCVLFCGLLFTFGNAQGPLDQIMQNPLLMQLFASQMSSQNANANAGAVSTGNTGSSSSGMDPMTMAMVLGANGGGFGGMDLQTLALMSSMGGGKAMDMSRLMQFSLLGSLGSI